MKKNNLKNKSLAILCAATMAVSSLSVINLTPVYADGMKVVSIGNDLTPEQKKTMEKYFGIQNNRSVQRINVTNKDEISHLASYIPLEQIGTRTVSCSYIKPTDKGGIKVRTANLQYVTANMIASTLADLGVENCEVISASPFEVSGTGALTGIIMAYETATGEKIDEAKKDIATQEVVITKDLAKDIGTTEAEFIINQAKSEAVQNNIADKQEIKNTVTNIVNNNNITISEDHIENITNLTQNIVNQNYGDTYVENLNEINNNIQQEIIASDDVNIEIDMDAVIETEKPDETEMAELEKDTIFADMDSEILGDNIIESSTDDPTLIVDSKAEASQSEDTSDSANEDELFEVTTETTEETVTEEPSENIEDAENTGTENEDETEDTENVAEENKFYDADGNLKFDSVELPENGIPYYQFYGTDVNNIKEMFGEETAKKYMLLEMFLQEKYPYDANNEADVKANAQITEGEEYQSSELEDKESHLASAIGKCVLDGYTEYFANDDTEISVMDIVLKFAGDMEVSIDDELKTFVEKLNITKEAVDEEMEEVIVEEEELESLEIPEEEMEEVVIPEGTSPKTDDVENTTTETTEEVTEEVTEEATEETTEEATDENNVIDISDVELPEDGVPYFRYYGINTNDLKERFGERIAKEYLLLEQELIKAYPYDDLNAADIDINADILYNSEEYINDETENKDSFLVGFLGKPVIEGYIQYFGDEDTSKSLLENIQECFDNHQVLEFEAAKHLDENLLKFISKMTARDEIVNEPTDAVDNEENIETNEDVGNIDISNIVLPENGVPYYKYYGHNVNWLKENYGERIAKEYIALENLLKDKYSFDPWNEFDAISNAEILNGDSNYLGDPDENKDSYLGSVIAKSVVDAYFEYFESETKDKSVIELANETLAFISPDLGMPAEVENFVNSMTFEAPKTETQTETTSENETEAGVAENATPETSPKTDEIEEEEEETNLFDLADEIVAAETEYKDFEYKLTKDGSLDTSNIEIPKNKKPYYRFYKHDLNIIKDRYGEKILKEYLLLEQFLDTVCPYGCANMYEVDEDANSDILIYNDEYTLDTDDNKATHLASALGRYVIDSYFDYLATKNPEKSFVETLKNEETFYLEEYPIRWEKVLKFAEVLTTDVEDNAVLQKDTKNNTTETTTENTTESTNENTEE